MVKPGRSAAWLNFIKLELARLNLEPHTMPGGIIRIHNSKADIRVCELQSITYHDLAQLEGHK